MPEKYQLMHFNRRRRHDSADLASTVWIAGHEATLQKTSIHVLGVWMDPRLRWTQHIQKATQKGKTAFEAASRIMASTWGPTMRRSRLLYIAVVWPTLIYGASVWGIRHDGKPQAESLLKPIQRVQNQCLRKIVGAYKWTPVAALERECAIPPVPLHIETIALQRAAKTALDLVKGETTNALSDIWNGRVRRRRSARRPPAPYEVLKDWAKNRKAEVKGYYVHLRDRE